MSKSTKSTKGTKVVKIQYVLAGVLLKLAKLGRKAADGVTSSVGQLAKTTLQADVAIAKLPKAERNKAFLAYNKFVLDARPDAERRSVSTQLTQIRKAAKVNGKARKAWLKGDASEYTVRGVLKQAARSNKSKPRFNAAKRAAFYTVTELRTKVAQFQAMLKIKLAQ